MFDLYLTKDLHLIELRTIIYKDKYIYTISETKRYALAKRTKNNKFIDIFTTNAYEEYNDSELVGSEVVLANKEIITNKKILTKREATFLLQVLNPVNQASALIKKPKMKIKKYN